LDPEWRRMRIAFRPEDGTVTLLQLVAAALVTVGSVLVLRTVWLADLEGHTSEPNPVESAPAEWRKAA
jgi:hypothetical protein